MDKSQSTNVWEDRFDKEHPQVANMDQYDFIVLLMESRVIPAS